MGNRDSVQKAFLLRVDTSPNTYNHSHYKNSNDFLKLKISVGVKVVQVHIDDFVTEHVVILCREKKTISLTLATGN